MDIAALVQSYGLWAVGLGSFLEGESVLLLAGAAAHRGLLPLPGVVAVAALASFCGDQLFFQVGRRWGDALLLRFPALQPRAAHMRALLLRHHLPVILSIRFLYGLRVAGPMAIGMSAVPWWRFALLNALGACVWAALVAGLGYGTGRVLGHALQAIDADELWSLAIVLAAAVLAWLWARRRQRCKQHLS